MGQITCDLHVHTTCSDASRSVQQVMEYAKMIGLTHIAVTDHDTMKGVDPAQEIGQKMGIRVIPGVEITTRDEETGRSVHMLCYLPKKRDVLEAFLKNTLKNRREQKLEMAAKLRKLYPFLTSRLIEAYAKDSASIHECHIMQPLCDMGYTNTAVGSLMESLISSKGSCYVPSRYPASEEAVRVIREAGGIAVVAHAQQFDSFDLIERYAVRGLIQGVEVWHPRNDEVSRKRLEALAKAHNLLKTGGSDYHGQYARNPRPLGYCGCTQEEVNALLEAGLNKADFSSSK